MNQALNKLPEIAKYLEISILFSVLNEYQAKNFARNWNIFVILSLPSMNVIKNFKEYHMMKLTV
jgi:hypothetical protein